MLIQQLTIFLPNFYSFPKHFSCGEITFLNIHKIQPTTHFFSCAAYFFFHVGMLFLRQNIHKFDLYQSESVVQICCRRTSYGLHDLYLEFTWCERLKILLITTLGGNAYRRRPEKQIRHWRLLVVCKDLFWLRLITCCFFCSCTLSWYMSF